MGSAMSIRIDTSQLKKLARALDDFAKKQVPFATAQAINAVAKQVQAAERVNMARVLDRPTPFTLNSISVKLANKSSLTAMVYVKDIAAAYLLPYEAGGLNKLNSRTLLKPVEQKVNQYGNLPRTTVKRLLARPNVFVGRVRFKKSGQVIDGIWERPAYGDRKQGGRGTKGNTQHKIGGVRTGLKLLIKFEDAHAAMPILGYQSLARKVVGAAFRRELDAAMKRAMATARR
uniref:Hypothethical protein n=1 Tax=Ralstonia solanacearum TaxID=305 RepID=A0A0S4V2H8_RALSL|nr:Hypothethical protein [Ralstonia solanacearum]